MTILTFAPRREALATTSLQASFPCATP
jgi:hypothetical protein